MRMPKLGARDRRAVLLGACVLLPALAWAVAVKPYLSAVADAREQLASERDLLARELELLAAAPTYPKTFDAGAERLLAAAPRLIAGDDPGAASAALAGYLRRVATIGGANLTRVEPAESREQAPGVRALPVGVTGESDLEGLLTFLQLLESGPKLLHVEDLRLEASATQATAGASYAATPFWTPPAAQPEVITFRFTATGFTLAAPPDSASASSASTDDHADEGAAELRVAEGRRR